MSTRASAIALIVLGAVSTYGQVPSHEQLANGHRLWEQRLAKSAIASFEAATKDPATAAEAWEALGRIYMFKGWQQESAFPGWHDETDARIKAVAALKRALAADPRRASASEALKQAYAFAASRTVVPPAPPRPEVLALDARIEAWPASNAPVADLEALIGARARLQADPAPYFTGAQMLIDRKEYGRAQALADRGSRAAARFMNENESAYLMVGKFRNARARSRAQALVIRGTIALARMDLAAAANFLEEADRLTRGQDLAAKVRLGDLAVARKDPDAAQEHYVNALALAGGAAPLRTQATEGLKRIRASRDQRGTFDAWLQDTVSRRRDERREQLLRSPIDRPLPPLAIARLNGSRLDAASFRGKVLLLNFFSSW